MAEGRGNLQARLELEPVLGNPTSLDLRVSVPRETSLNWNVEGGSGFVRALEQQALPEALPLLLSLGPAPCLQRAVIQTQLPSVQHWRLQFGRPLARRESIVLRGTLEPRRRFDSKALAFYLPAPLVPPPAALWGLGGLAKGPLASGERWDIPLLMIPDADRQETEVILQPRGVELVQIETSGLEEVSGRGQRENARDTWRVFRFGPSLQGSFPHLRVATRTHAANQWKREWCDDAHLTTYVQAGDHLLHHFRFRVWNWGKRDLVVFLPAGTTKVLAAMVDGHALEQLPQEQTRVGWQVKFPAALDKEAHSFELYYLSAATWSGWPGWADLEVPLPQLPMTSSCFRRTWRLAPGLVPLHQEDLQSLAGLPGFAQDLRRAWHVGDPVLGEDFPYFGADSLELQRQVFLGAELGLRRKLTKDMTLGEALDRLAHEFLKEQLPLVVDRAALRAADLRPDLSLAPLFGEPPGSARPFWEAAGVNLCTVPKRAGAHHPSATGRMATNPRPSSGGAKCMGSCRGPSHRWRT